jgi:hypothetical protein
MLTLRHANPGPSSKKRRLFRIFGAKDAMTPDSGRFWHQVRFCQFAALPDLKNRAPRESFVSSRSVKNQRDTDTFQSPAGLAIRQQVRGLAPTNAGHDLA